MLDVDYGTVTRMYESLIRQDRGDSTPRRVPWPTSVVEYATNQHPEPGYATLADGGEVFVGENGDLLWRALTETTLSGLSPLKAGLRRWEQSNIEKEMIVAAAVYDETAAYQLTHGLFEGVASDDRAHVHKTVLMSLMFGQHGSADAEVPLDRRTNVTYRRVHQNG